MLGHNLLLSRAFRWESPWRWDLGHNLLLSQAFRWESLWRWDLGHNLLSQAFRWESLWRWDFRLLRSLWLSRSLFTNSSSFTMEFRLLRSLSEFFFHTIEFWLSRSLFHKFLFHTMEFWLSRSLVTNFSFTRWNSGYQGAFSQILLSHDGILAIKEPFFTNFSFTW
jgi:hypothetical protein